MLAEGTTGCLKRSRSYHLDDAPGPKHPEGSLSRWRQSYPDEAAPHVLQATASRLRLLCGAQLPESVMSAKTCSTAEGAPDLAKRPVLDELVQGVGCYVQDAEIPADFTYPLTEIRLDPVATTQLMRIGFDRPDV